MSTSIYIATDLSGYLNPIIVDNPSLFPDPATVPGAWYLAENSSGTRWLFTYKSEGLYYSNGVKWITANQILPVTQVELDTGTETEKYVNAFTFNNAAKWLTKADTLVSGTNIKTINGNSLLGSGDLVISGGTSRNNYLQVKTVTDLSPYDQGTHYLIPDNYTIELNGQIVLGTKYIVLGVSNLIRGLDKSDDGIVYTGTGAAIRSTNKDFSLRSFYIVANNVAGKALDLTGDGTNIFEISELIFNTCTSIGDNNGGFDISVFRNCLAVNCSQGFTTTGTNDDIIIVDNIFKEAFAGTNPTYLNFPSGTVSVGIVRGNHFEVDTGEVAIDLAIGVTINGTFDIQNNTVTGLGTGLTGKNANSTNVNIPSRSNKGIAGLFRTNRTVILGTLSSTTSGTWLSVTQQVLTRNAVTDYEPHATILRGRLNVGMTHDVSGASVGFRLFNLTDNVAVVGSEVPAVTITTGGVYQIFQGPEVDLQVGKEYRVQIIKNTGTGGQSVYVNAGDLEITAY